ncbi:HD domain-containing protein [Yersinia ruckeri]|uniref:HD domain-containing protein n=1 Tax=Yersinia ruckeri TaxID=29486 RepID=UPI0022372903|nr:HD domain-containing protein [Yersinia ruckeri]MCW6623658.1 HD domain-containing protein [Yersinia ruckeri]
MTQSTQSNKVDNFENLLSGKFLDPIHGVIRITKLEKKIIDHPLFQRLRDVRQNTFLYKVFPSAMHSRFEHSVGVMHLSYEILKNLDLNALIYKRKNKEINLYTEIKELPASLIQELRIAALLHDVGHGPLAHQFDSFAINREKFKEKCKNEGTEKYNDIISLNNNEKLSHEQISCIFIMKIIEDLKGNSESDDEVFKENIATINIDSIIKIVEKEYKFEKKINNLNIYPLLGSIISSSPIDADRMDYLLRDSYFSGVKYGIYDYGRLLMSFIPVIKDKNVFLAYKESGMDSILEFTNARSSLYSQVYFHKTNRALSSMLDKACSELGSEVINVIPSDSDGKIIDIMQDFYIKNPDKKFLEHTLKDKLNDEQKKQIIEDIVNRKVWKKIYEKKHTFSNADLKEINWDECKKELSKKVNSIINEYIEGIEWAIDFKIEDNFKDMNKSQALILKKKTDEKYDIKKLCEYNKALQPYHHVKFFIRVFVSKKIRDEISDKLGQLAENIEKEVENKVISIEGKLRK